jgi:hypothetical protein
MQNKQPEYRNAQEGRRRGRNLQTQNPASHAAQNLQGPPTVEVGRRRTGQHRNATVTSCQKAWTELV